MASKKSVKIVEYQDDNHIDDKGILYCVKTQWWEDGLLQFTEEKKFFKKEKEAREATKRAAKVKAEEDRKKAAARKAKKARRDAEIAAEAFKKISKYINEANKKTKTKKMKTEKDE